MSDRTLYCYECGMVNGNHAEPCNVGKIRELEATLGQHTNVPLINENARLKAKVNQLEDEIHLLKTEHAVREADMGSEAARRNEAKQVTIDQYFESGRRAAAHAAHQLALGRLEVA